MSKQKESGPIRIQVRHFLSSFLQSEIQQGFRPELNSNLSHRNFREPVMNADVSPETIGRRPTPYAMSGLRFVISGRHGDDQEERSVSASMA